MVNQNRDKFLCRLSEEIIMFRDIDTDLSVLLERIYTFKLVGLEETIKIVAT
jgi:hypothetical protein